MYTKYRRNVDINTSRNSDEWCGAKHLIFELQFDDDDRHSPDRKKQK